MFHIYHYPSLKSRIKGVIAKPFEKGLVWKEVFSGPVELYISKDVKFVVKWAEVCKACTSIKFRYELEVLEEEWTGRPQIIIIRETIYD